MSELSLTELIHKFDRISKTLAANEIIYPRLEIKMRLDWREDSEMFYASFDHVEIKDGDLLTSTCGDGETPEEAMRDYYNKIVGKRLVFHAMDERYRRECVAVVG